MGEVDTVPAYSLCSEAIAFCEYKSWGRQGSTSPHRVSSMNRWQAGHHHPMGTERRFRFSSRILTYVRYIGCCRFWLPDELVVQWLGHRGLVHTIVHLIDSTDKPVVEGASSWGYGIPAWWWWYVGPIQRNSIESQKGERCSGFLAPFLGKGLYFEVPVSVYSDTSIQDLSSARLMVSPVWCYWCTTQRGITL